MIGKRTSSRRKGGTRKFDTRTIEMALLEIGRRQRAGLMPNACGRSSHDPAGEHAAAGMSEQFVH